jgi:hypothetical protein
LIVKDILKKTDEEMQAMLESIGHEPVEWTPIILAELTRRSVVRLGDSSRRLERLTCWLIALTVVIGVVALPPAIDVITRLFK